MPGPAGRRETDRGGISMELKGLHHVSAITADIEENYRFYTQVLGMRLVKKSVNQDNPLSYLCFTPTRLGVRART